MQVYKYISQVSGERLQDHWSSGYIYTFVDLAINRPRSFKGHDLYKLCRHYENTPMQYTEILKVVKKENFH